MMLVTDKILRNAARMMEASIGWKQKDLFPSGLSKEDEQKLNKFRKEIRENS